MWRSFGLYVVAAYLSLIRASLSSGAGAPAQVPELSGVAKAAGGGSHSLALKRDGTVWAWGRNDAGQLGDGTTTGRHLPSQVGGLNGVKAIGAGTFHSLALKSDGTVWTWGSNDWGQLGDETFTAHTTPVQVKGLTEVVEIAAGGYHNLALKKDGTVWAWGANWSGQLGSGLEIPGRPGAALVGGLNGVISVAADPDHSLALKGDGSVWTWGWIGWIDGASRCQPTPAEAGGLGGVILAAWASGHALAVKTDGTVWEWGIPDKGIQWTLTQVNGLSGVAALAGGDAIEYYCGTCGHRLALKGDGTVWAWGDNADGQLGYQTTTEWPGRMMTPTRVPGLAGLVSIGAGELHSLAVTGDGMVWAWGDNDSGQLGRERTGRRVASGQAPLEYLP
jgi:alpha-tubulin suppressor-like RCC1 family protein